MKTKANELIPPVWEQPADIFEGEPEGQTDEMPVDVDISESGEPPPEPSDKKLTTMKIIVWFCLLNGIAWVWCSYILAWMGKEQIAESLSQVALTEIIAVVLVYAAKSVFENLSKNNSWPDKPASGPPMG